MHNIHLSKDLQILSKIPSVKIILFIDLAMIPSFKPTTYKSHWWAFLTACDSESESEVAQSCLTLCNPMDYSLPVFSICRIFQARVLEWVPFSAPGDLPNPGIEPGSPALQADALQSEPPNAKEVSHPVRNTHKFRKPTYNYQKGVKDEWEIKSLLISYT